MKTPVEVVNSVFAALDWEDWAGLAELCDPVSLRAFKREILDEFPGDEPGFVVEVDDLIANEPDLTREAAEYKLEEMKRYMDPTNRLKRQLWSVESVEELRAMDPGRVFARWLMARSHDHWHPSDGEHAEAWQAAGDDPSKKPTRAYGYIALGSVLVGAEIAYVTYRKEFGPEEVYPGVMDDWAASVPADEAELARVTRYLYEPRVATCRRQSDGSWLVVANRALLLVGSPQIVAFRLGDGD